MARIIVGISAFFHDSACCVLRDGKLVAAAQEERFIREKETADLPVNALQFCLRETRATLADVDCIGYYEEPVKKLERQLWMGFPDVPLASPSAVGRLNALKPEHEIREQLGFEGPIEYFPHHLSHAASAYCFSGFRRSSILCVDGVGEWATTSYGIGDQDGIRIVDEVCFPNSLGLFYSALTAYLGFRVNRDEYKVMGLSAYGRPLFVDQLRSVIGNSVDGQYCLDMRFFNFGRGEEMFSDDLSTLLGHQPLTPNLGYSQFAADIAKSAQLILEELLLEKLVYLRTRSDADSIALAGGVMHNCVAVGRIKRDSPFRNIFLQPAAGDAGACLGAAACADQALTGKLPLTVLKDVYLGPAFSTQRLTRLLREAKVPFESFTGSTPCLIRQVAERLSRGQIVGWFQGRMEFGPRALGNRSILADPRDQEIRNRLNRMVKGREEFRPFAPSVTEEGASRYFDLNYEAPFMVSTCSVLRPAEIPATTHVDGSARPQTVNRAIAPKFHQLLEEFERITGVPVLLNTSFNYADEPIVCTPVDALLSFVRCGLDILVVEDIVIQRVDLPAWWGPAVARAWRPSPHQLSNVYTLL